jgi:hypothetical protein
MRINELGEVEYEVEWEGYFEEDGITPERTWEPLQSVADLDEKLHEFFCSDPMPGCRYKHHRKVCKCHRPVYRLGQDESIFKQFVQSSRSWTIHGVRSLRKKTKGAGVMTYAFCASCAASASP